MPPNGAWFTRPSHRTWLYQKHQVVKIEVLARHVGDCLLCVDVMSLYSECAWQTVLRVFDGTGACARCRPDETLLNL